VIPNWAVTLSRVRVHTNLVGAVIRKLNECDGTRATTRLFSSRKSRFSKPETFSTPVSIRELDSKALQSELDRACGLVRDYSSFLFKIDDRR